MQEKLVNLLEQLNPKISDLEKLLGLNSEILNTYTRKSQRRTMPDDVQIKIKTYLITAANFVLSELKDDMYEKSTPITKLSNSKKSNNPSLVKDMNRYYPDGSGYVHFTINSKYYMTNDSECTVDGKTYEFNPNTKIVGMMSEKYVPTVKPKIDLPTATVVLPNPEIKAFVSKDINLQSQDQSKAILVLSDQILRYDDIADETPL